MADVSITRNHNLDPALLKERLEGLAAEMTRKFGVKARWEGDTCHLSGNPLKNGKVIMTADSVTLELTLGLLGKALKGPIQKEVDSRLTTLLS